jgi:dTDP-4-dehydrorhamnose reductase
MRIVVTGTREGQLARSLIERAGALGDLAVVPIGRPELDLLDLGSIGPALRAQSPDLIINAAAYTAVDQAESEPELAQRINAEAAGRVAQTAAALRVPVIQVSTDYVFDGTATVPYRESDPVAPLGIYGRTKLAGEAAVASATPNHAIVRTAWVYSPFGRNFVRTMLRLGETRAEVAVVADQEGAPTSALDLAQALLAMSRRLAAEPGTGSLRGIFHATGSGAATWAGFAQAIFAEAERHGRAPVRVRPIATAEYPTPARRPAYSRLDNTKLAQVYGIGLPDWQGSTADCVARLLAGAENRDHRP